MAVGYLYTGGPVPISWTPFGEIFAGFFMGTVIIMITFFIHTGTLHVFPLLMSIPPAITIGLLNMANNIRDRKKDKESGRKTYVILVGKPIAVMTAAVLLIFSYVFLITSHSYIDGLTVSAHSAAVHTACDEDDYVDEKEIHRPN